MSEYTVLTADRVFTKHPDESWTGDAKRSLDFTRALNGASVSSVAIEAVTEAEDTTQDGTTFAVSNASNSSGVISYEVTGGYDSGDYLVQITVTLSGGGTVVGLQRVQVRSK